MRRFCPIAGVWLLLGCPLTATAQAPVDLEQLLGQSIVSTPSKGSETDTNAPATSSVLTADEMRRYGIRTLDEAINYLSLGMSTSSANRVAEIGARGVLINGDYGTHMLLLVDGHAVNEPWNGTAYFDRGLGVPWEMIDQIEVIVGPGSVLYGSQAMLGVINVVTKRAKDHRGMRAVAEVEAVAPPAKTNGPTAPPLPDALGGGYRIGAGYGREFTIGNSASEITAGIEYYAAKGPVWQLGPQRYGDDSTTQAPKNFGSRATPGEWGGLLRHADYVQVPALYLRFATGDFRAAFRASAFRRGTAFPDSLAADMGDFDHPYNRELDRFVHLDLSQRVDVSSRVELMLRGYGDFYGYDLRNRTSAAEDCPEGLVVGCDRLLEATGRTLGSEVKTQIQWPFLRAHTLVGVDGKMRWVHDRQTILDHVGIVSVPEQGGGSRLSGLLAPYTAQSISPTNWLDLNVGARLDYDSRFGDRLSPRMAAGVTPWAGARVKGIYAEAFRGPSAYELTYADPNMQIAAPSLGPETVRSIEGSFEQRFGKHRIRLSLFRSWWNGLTELVSLTPTEIDGAIARGELAAGVSSASEYANASQVDNYGFSVGYEGAAAAGRLRFGVNFTGAHTQVDARGGASVRMPTVAPRAFGNARASYDLGGDLPTVALAARFAGRRLADRAYDGGFAATPVAPPLFAARLTIGGGLPLLSDVTYRLGGEYSAAAIEPYVIGALLYANDETSRAELAPSHRVQVFLGFEYAPVNSPF